MTHIDPSKHVLYVRPVESSTYHTNPEILHTILNITLYTPPHSLGESRQGSEEPRPGAAAHLQGLRALEVAAARSAHPQSVAPPGPLRPHRRSVLTPDAAQDTRRAEVRREFTREAHGRPDPRNRGEQDYCEQRSREEEGAGRGAASVHAGKRQEQNDESPLRAGAAARAERD